MPIRRLIQFKEKAAPRGSFKANVLTLMTGTGIAQLIPIAVSPILTRLYTPSDFGLFATYLAIVTILALISTGRYDLAITLPRTDEDALHVSFLTIIMTSLFSLACWVLIIIFGRALDLSPNFVILREFSYLVPLGIFLTGVFQSLSCWMIRKKRFNVLAVRRVIQFGVWGLLQVIFGFMALGFLGLIGGYILGQVAGYGFLARLVWKDNKKDMLAITLNGLLQQAVRYKKFLFYSVPSSLFNILALQLPTLLLNNFFGPAVVGYFDLPTRVFSAPTSLVSNSITDVFRERASSDYVMNGNCREIYIKTIKGLFLLAFPPFLFLFIFSPKLIPFIFGPNWHEAGIYAQYLSLSAFMLFIVSPLGYVLLIVEKQVVNLIFQACLLLGSFAAIWIGVYLHSPRLSVLYFSLTLVVVWTFLLIVSYHYSLPLVRKISQ